MPAVTRLPPTPPTRPLCCAALRCQVKTLPGEHVRPLQQDLTRISPDLVKVANQAVAQSNDWLGQLSALGKGFGLPEQVGARLREGWRVGGEECGWVTGALGLGRYVGYMWARGLGRRLGLPGQLVPRVALAGPFSHLCGACCRYPYLYCTRGTRGHNARVGIGRCHHSALSALVFSPLHCH